MSEFQYYEWLALDRPLTKAEQIEVDKLSSHIEVSATRAQVDYSWGEFKHNATEVLATYFDAHIYMANWGARELLFRFPIGAVDREQLLLYCTGEEVDLRQINGYDVLSITLGQDGEEDWEGWIESEGILSSLIPLRTAIMQGDYRSVYLAWLYVATQITEEFEPYDDDEYEEEDGNEVLERPVPAGLKELDSALEELVGFLRLDSYTLAAAAENSAPLKADKPINYGALLQQLSLSECQQWLEKVVTNQPGAAALLRKHLMRFSRSSEKIENQQKLRPITALIERAQELEEEETRHEKEEAKRIHDKKMMELAPRKATMWATVEKLLVESKPSHYNEATTIMDQLEQLAAFQGDSAEFLRRVRTLATRYERRWALLERWGKKKWI